MKAFVFSALLCIMAPTGCCAEDIVLCPLSSNSPVATLTAGANPACGMGNLPRCHDNVPDTKWIKIRLSGPGSETLPATRVATIYKSTWSISIIDPYFAVIHIHSP
ncbi:MAG: hypothetical protein HC896_07035 [Bacteroidales bacterium]|nr:hypothetical protein [Bacteroidales bacterium]